MTSRFDTQVQAITRRRFGQWSLAAAASGVAGCGGGGGGEPNVEPPAKVGALEMVAGLLGGGGFAISQGEMVRLPAELTGLSFNSKRDLQFVGVYGWDSRVGRRSHDGVSSFAPTYPHSFIGHLFDAMDRYLVTTGGGSVHYLQGETPVLLAGGGTNTGLVDGVGASASLLYFDSPLLARDGLVYFIDQDPQKGFQPMLRTLGTDGAVKTLLPLPRGSLLLESSTGGVRRYTKFTGDPYEWADLVLVGGEYQWRALPNQWPFDHWTPLMKVHPDQDVYWAIAEGQGAREFAIGHIDLSGITPSGLWKLRGRKVAVVREPSNTAQGSLFVACSDPLEGGSEVVACRLEMPTTAVSRWLGAQANAGEVDGQSQARFSFVRGVEALPDGVGGLILLENQRGNSSEAAPVPALRSVSASGQVSTWSLEPRGNRMAIAYGQLIAYDTQNRALIRTSTNGQSAWQSWVSSSHFASGGRHDPGVQVLRTDTTGLLWFATRYSPQPSDGDVYFGRANGNALVGTIDANGQVKIVAGDPQAQYTPQSYPPLAQRPWYMDIADMAFEGGTAQVSWVLCNRVELDGATALVRFHPELVRIDTQGIQRFPLSLEIDRNLPEFFQEPFKQICVLPGRPGEVFLSSACGVHRWTQAKGLELLAGQAAPTPGGVLLGPLPAGLNLVKFLAPGVDRRSLYVGSENSVLKLVLPD